MEAAWFAIVSAMLATYVCWMASTSAPVSCTGRARTDG